MLARLQDKEPEPYELVVVHKRYQPHLHIPGTWVSKREGGEPEAEGEERKIARAQTRPESPPRFTMYFSRISSSSSSSSNLLFNREKEMMNSNRSPFPYPIFISPIERNVLQE